MNIQLAQGWSILQDVHDIGEKCEIYEAGYNNVSTSSQFSEWEPIAYLSHLQPYLEEKPYFGRNLRYFNAAPWWYRNTFMIPDGSPLTNTAIRFEGVDYYCKIWVNGVYAGEHEGYGTPFEVETSALLRWGANTVVVKVWSPWDNEVLEGMEHRRVFHVVRGMMKGTYEHDDTLIQRDVNPVGIYGAVTVVLKESARLVGKPRVMKASCDGLVQGAVRIAGGGSALAELRVVICEKDSGIAVASSKVQVQRVAGETEFALEVKQPNVWTTWDRGYPHLYEAKVELLVDGVVADSGDVVFGFRDIGLVRNTEETTFVLNGRRIYWRGTCYLPDVYVSEMNGDRYKRDMDLVKLNGFNAIRVHVHTALPELYALCDELGIAVIQDSDFNWTHDDSDGFAARSAAVLRDMIDHLRSHPSIVAWVCMNEPDFIKDRRQVDGSPGPQLWAAAQQADPWRPAIKASYLGDDPHSGDTHNYIGSLEDESSLYTEIVRVPEKLNTEFGIDAPPQAANLRRVKEVWDRIGRIEDGIDSIQYYQYRLLKFYMEHYRLTKYGPCSGYFQFMLNDLCPQSYYGLYDWWGVPKKAIEACGESNMPIAVIARVLEPGRGLDIVFVNDLLSRLAQVTVSWSVVTEDSEAVARGEVVVDAEPDSLLVAARLAGDALALDGHGRYRVLLRATDASGQVLATNRYDDLLGHPPRPEGHPRRMSHELGVRLFHA